MNITQTAKRLVFCGTFTAGGLMIAVTDGKLALAIKSDWFWGNTLSAPVVYPAAGDDSSSVGIAFEHLQRLSGGRLVEVCG